MPKYWTKVTKQHFSHSKDESSEHYTNIGVGTGGGGGFNILGCLFIILRELRMHEIYVNLEPYTCGGWLSDEMGQRHTNIFPKPWL